MTETINLQGQAALITGASSGLGAHFATVLAEQGATVVLAARRLEKLDALKAEIEARGGNALAVTMDVTSATSVTAAFEAIANQLSSPCSIVINNSGVGQESWFVDTTEEEWANIIDTNLTGVWRVAKHAGKRLMDAGQAGSIINIASITAQRPAYMVSGYAASKAAVEQLTRNMALEFARSKIRVNAIAPGYFSTSINDSFLSSEAGERMR